jgi:hypothetical protein
MTPAGIYAVVVPRFRPLNGLFQCEGFCEPFGKQLAGRCLFPVGPRRSNRAQFIGDCPEFFAAGNLSRPSDGAHALIVGNVFFQLSDACANEIPIACRQRCKCWIIENRREIRQATAEIGRRTPQALGGGVAFGRANLRYLRPQISSGQFAICHKQCDHERDHGGRHAAGRTRQPE